MKSGDLISRQAAIDAMATWDWQDSYLPIHFKQLLEDLPSAQPDVTEEAVKDYCRKRCLTILTNDYYHKLSSAQPKRKEGRWIFDDNDHLTHCSSCGQGEWKGYIPTPEEATKWMPICPKCGAYMRGGEEDERI